MMGYPLACRGNCDQGRRECPHTDDCLAPDPSATSAFAWTVIVIMVVILWWALS